MNHRLISLIQVISLLVFGAVIGSGCRTAPPAAKQQSLNEWRNLTAPTAQPPRVFVKGDQVRFYFNTDSGVEAFRGEWSRLRVPTSGLRAHSALLHWDQKLSAVPTPDRWREASVIAGAEWRQRATN